ncbi:MAG: CPBP family intramembrane glutamic endopeptidase [Eubacteriales bacterium]|jgi:membrane protease YdiL (CAAX protease family)
MNLPDTDRPGQQQSEPGKRRLRLKIFGSGDARRKNPAAWLVLVTYLLLLFSRLLDVLLLSRDNEYLIVVILQIMVFLIPAALYIRLRGLTAVNLRLRIPGLPHILLILAAALALITGSFLLGMVFGPDSMQGSFSLYDTFISKPEGGIANTLYLIIAYAALPAVCEELVFRSVLCAEYERGGLVCAVFFSSFFFGLLHFDLGSLPVYIYAGALLALTMYVARSAVAAMAVHFLYNLFGLFSQPYLTTFCRTTSSLGLFVVILVALLLLSVAVFCGQAGRLLRWYSELNMSPEYPTGLTARQTLASFESAIRSLPAVLCIVLYVVTVIISR